MSLVGNQGLQWWSHLQQDRTRKSSLLFWSYCHWDTDLPAALESASEIIGDTNVQKDKSWPIFWLFRRLWFQGQGSLIYINRIFPTPFLLESPGVFLNLFRINFLLSYFWKANGNVDQPDSAFTTIPCHLYPWERFCHRFVIQELKLNSNLRKEGSPTTHSWRVQSTLARSHGNRSLNQLSHIVR